MKNNKGFGTKEIAILVVAILLIFTGLFMSVMGGASKQKAITFNDNALTFSKTVIANQASFLNPDYVYLQEAIDQEVIKNVHNALGKGDCDPTQSKVVTNNGHAYTTLKCDKYLIDNYEIKDTNEIEIYEVSEWSEKKPKGENIEERVLYNVVDNGKNMFPDYYEEAYLAYATGKETQSTIRTFDSIERITGLKTVSKTFYRTKEKIKVKD